MTEKQVKKLAKEIAADYLISLQQINDGGPDPIAVYERFKKEARQILAEREKQKTT